MAWGELTFNLTKVCPVCKKKFIPEPQHVYHDKRVGHKASAPPVCSYHCMRETERLKEAARDKRLSERVRREREKPTERIGRYHMTRAEIDELKLSELAECPFCGCKELAYERGFTGAERYVQRIGGGEPRLAADAYRVYRYTGEGQRATCAECGRTLGDRVKDQVSKDVRERLASDDDERAV